MSDKEKELDLFLLGKKYNKAFKFEEAIKYLTKAIRLNNQVSEYFNERGASHFRIFQYEEAIDDFTKAINIKEEHHYFANRASCFTSQKKWGEVIKDYSKAIEINKNELAKNREYTIELGTAYKEIGQNENALNLYREFLETNPNDIIIESAYKNLMEELGKGIYNPTLQTTSGCLADAIVLPLLVLGGLLIFISPIGLVIVVAIVFFYFALKK